MFRESTSDWIALLGPGEVCAENEATIARLAERLALAPAEASGVAIERIERSRTGGRIFYLEVDPSGGGFDEIFGSDGTLMYAAHGISAGHDAGGGNAHAFRVKRFSGTIGGTGTITQALGTTDVLGYTVGVLFMMSNSTSNPYTFQVYDWRYSASNGFYVEVTTNTTSGVGDVVTVTFDTTRYTNSGAPW